MRTFAKVISLAAALAWVYRHLFRGELLAGRDVLRLAYPDAALLRSSLLQGELPLWNPHVFLGQPFAATLQAQAFYPPRILFTLLFGPYWGVSLLQVFHAGLAVAGAALALRALGRSRWASALGGAAFGLSPLFTELSGTPNMASAAAWSGAIVWATVRGRPLALALLVAASVLCGAPETVLWQLVIAAAVWAGQRRASLRTTLGATVAGWAGGALLSAIVWVPALELARLSSRGEGMGSHLDWSASWRQLAALAWPNADHPRGPYWGDDQWLLLQLFLGTSVVALAALGASRRRWLAAAVAGLLLLSLGRHFPPSELLLSLPGLSAFRYPAKALVGAGFGIALLAGFGFDRCRALLRRRPVRRAPLAAAAAACALLALAGPRGAGWVAAVLGAGLLVFAARARAAPALLLLVVGVELLLFQLRFAGTSLARADALARLSGIAALAQGGRISVDYRPPPGAPAEPEAQIEVTRGRDAFAEASRAFAIPNRFLEDGLTALEGYGAPEPPRIQQFHLARSRQVADLAGVTLYLRADALAHPDLEDVTPDPDGPRTGRSTTALPRARILHRTERVPDEEALRRIGAGEGRDTLLLAEGEPGPAADCAGSTAAITRASANALSVDVTACAPGHLLIADAYFPGWEATVNGAPAAIHRAQYALRAVPVPAGVSQVTLRYRPLSFQIGAGLSLLAVAVGAGAVLRRRRRGPYAART